MYAAMRNREHSSAGRKLAAAVLLLVPLLLGLALRLTGIRHGEPDMVYHPDVAKQTVVARSVYHGSSDIRRIYKEDVCRTLYPYGTAYILGKVLRRYSRLTGDESLDDVHRWCWALRMRYVSVAFILAAVAILIPVMARRIGSTAAALLGALLLLEPVNAYFSHYGMNDVPLVAMLLLCWLCAGLMSEERRVPVYSLAAGLAVGLGFGIKYQAVLGLVFPGIAWLLLLRSKGWKWAVASAVAVAVGSVAGALMTTPLLRREPAYFIAKLPEFMEWQASIMGEQTPLGTKLARNIPAFLRIAGARGGWLLGVCAAWVVAGHVKTANRDRRVTIWGLSALIFCTLLAMAIVASRDIIRANDIMPVTAFACAIACLGDWRWPRWSESKGRRFIPLIGVPIVAAVFLAESVGESRALARPDTRILARQWCRENLETPSVVLRERYTLSADKEGARDIRFRYLGEPKGRSRLESGKFDYVITSSLAHDRFFDRHSPYHDEEAQAAYEGIRNELTCIATFSDREMTFAQPHITIYARKEPE